MKPSLLYGVLVCLLAACTARSTAQPPAPTAILQPYLTATASLTPEPPLQAVETPLPTSTPFTYTVASGDTLSGIAEKFRVPLNDLLAANPGISPNSMSVGTVLMVPSDPNNPGGEPTPTPVGLPVRQVDCYPTAEGGMWCFVLVQNDSPGPVENVSAQVTLHSPAGQVLASQAALSPLNTLPAGGSLPLTVFFPPVVLEETRPSVQMLTATRLLAGDKRYLPIVLQSSLIEVDWSGQAAQVSGEAFLPADAPAPAGRVWVAAVAYSADGRLAGVRRWEGTTEIAPGGVAGFSFSISSLGPPIARVELFLEARPK